MHSCTVVTKQCAGGVSVPLYPHSKMVTYAKGQCPTTHCCGTQCVIKHAYQLSMCPPKIVMRARLIPIVCSTLTTWALLVYTE